MRGTVLKMTTVGIDYGNINSSVAIIQNERSEVVADAGGHRYAI